MGTIVVWRNLTPFEADLTIRDVGRWFANHPKKRVATVGAGVTTLFKVRRGHIREDILSHTDGEKEK